MPGIPPAPTDFGMKSMSVRRTLMRWVGWTTTATGLALVLVYGIESGRAAAIGAGVGGVVVAVFFLTGVALSTMSTRPGAPDGTVLLMAMLGYGAQVIGLFLVLLVFRHTSLFDHRAFGISVLVGTVVAMAAAVTGFLRAKIVTVQPDPVTAPAAPATLRDRL